MQQEKKHFTVEFSEAEMARIKEFAEHQGLSVTEAIDKLASAALQARFVRTLAPKSNVLKFSKKGDQ